MRGINSEKVSRGMDTAETGVRTTAEIHRHKPQENTRIGCTGEEKINRYRLGHAEQPGAGIARCQFTVYRGNGEFAFTADNYRLQYFYGTTIGIFSRPCAQLSQWRVAFGFPQTSEGSSKLALNSYDSLCADGRHSFDGQRKELAVQKPEGKPAFPDPGRLSGWHG